MCLVSVCCVAQENTFPISGDPIEIGSLVTPQRETLILRFPGIPHVYGSGEYGVKAIYGPDNKTIVDSDQAPNTAIGFEYLTQVPLETEVLTDGHSINLIIRQPLAPGEYTIEFAKTDNSELHLRKFKVIESEPVINSVKLLSQSGTPGEILFNPDINWKVQVFEFDFRDDNPQFERVSFQGMSLKKVPGKPNQYATTSDWTSDKIKNLEPTKNEFSFKRKFVDAEDVHTFTMKLPAPVINGFDPFTVGIDQQTAQVTLNGSGFLNGASVVLTNVPGEDHIKPDELFGVEKPNGTSKIGFTVRLKDTSTPRSISFMAQVKLGTAVSNKFKVNVAVNSAVAEAKQASSEIQLIKGTTSELVFTIKNNEVLDQSKGLKLVVDQDTMDLKIVEITPKTAKVKMGISEDLRSEATFKLLNGDESWVGKLPKFLEKPMIVLESDTVYTNSSVTVHLKPSYEKTEVAFRSDIKDLKWTGGIFSGANSVLEIKSMKDSEMVSGEAYGEIWLVIRDHQRKIDSLAIKVFRRADPKDMFEIQHLVEKKDRDGNVKKSIIVLDNQLLSIKDDAALSASELDQIDDIQIQLMDAKGAAVGEAKSLKRDNSNFKAEFKLKDRYGMANGSNFGVLIKNGNEDEYYRGYLKREFKDRFILNGGISALSLYFKSIETDTPIDTVEVNGEEVINYERTNATLFNGLNVGFFYSPEWWRDNGKRPFAFGVNLMGFESRGNVRTRFAVSTLFYETLTIGVSFGQKQPALLLGANITLLDFAKIFGESSSE